MQLISSISGEGRTPFYNTMQPIRYKIDSNGKKVYEFETRYKTVNAPIKMQMQNIEGYKKTLPIELLGSQVGISTRANYPNRGGKAKLKKAKTIAKYARKNIEKNR